MISRDVLVRALVRFVFDLGVGEGEPVFLSCLIANKSIAEHGRRFEVVCDHVPVDVIVRTEPRIVVFTVEMTFGYDDGAV